MQVIILAISMLSSLQKRNKKVELEVEKTRQESDKSIDVDFEDLYSNKRETNKPREKRCSPFAYVIVGKVWVLAGLGTRLQLSPSSSSLVPLRWMGMTMQSFLPRTQQVALSWEPQFQPEK